MSEEDLRKALVRGTDPASVDHCQRVLIAFLKQAQPSSFYLVFVEILEAMFQSKGRSWLVLKPNSEDIFSTQGIFFRYLFFQTSFAPSFILPFEKLPRSSCRLLSYASEAPGLVQLPPLYRDKKIVPSDRGIELSIYSYFFYSFCSYLLQDHTPVPIRIPTQRGSVASNNPVLTSLLARTTDFTQRWNYILRSPQDLRLLLSSESARQKAQIQASKRAYQRLLQDYLDFFLPHKRQSRQTRTFGLLAQSLSSSRLAHHAEAFLVVIAEFWLNNYCTTTDVWAPEEYEPPSVELLESVSRVVVHLLSHPQFQKRSSTDSPGMDLEEVQSPEGDYGDIDNDGGYSLASESDRLRDSSLFIENSIAILRKPLFEMLRAAFSHWPRQWDAGFSQILTLWKTYLEPWKASARRTQICAPLGVLPSSSDFHKAKRRSWLPPWPPTPKWQQQAQTLLTGYSISNGCLAVLKRWIAKLRALDSYAESTVPSESDQSDQSDESERSDHFGQGIPDDRSETQSEPETPSKASRSPAPSGFYHEDADLISSDDSGYQSTWQLSVIENYFFFTALLAEMLQRATDLLGQELELVFNPSQLKITTENLRVLSQALNVYNEDLISVLSECEFELLTNLLAPPNSHSKSQLGETLVQQLAEVGLDFERYIPLWHMTEDGDERDQWGSPAFRSARSRREKPRESMGAARLARPLLEVLAQYTTRFRKIGEGRKKSRMSDAVSGGRWRGGTAELVVQRIQAQIIQIFRLEDKESGLQLEDDGLMSRSISPLSRQISSEQQATVTTTAAMERRLSSVRSFLGSVLGGRDQKGVVTDESPFNPILPEYSTNSRFLAKKAREQIRNGTRICRNSEVYAPFLGSEWDRPIRSDEIPCLVHLTHYLANSWDEYIAKPLVDSDKLVVRLAVALFGVIGAILGVFGIRSLRVFASYKGLAYTFLASLCWYLWYGRTK